MVGVVAPPGFGKSTLVLSAAKSAGKRLEAFCAPGGEGLTYEGQSELVRLHMYEDPEWQPDLGVKNAGAFTQALKDMWALRADKTVEVVGVDTVNAFQALAEHECCNKFGVNSSAELQPNNRYNFWDHLKGRMNQLMGVVKALRQSGKHVICTFHQDIREVEGSQGQAKTNPTTGVLEMVWSEGRVPALKGSIRDIIAGDFDIFSFLERDIGNPTTYWLRVKPSATAWAKMRAPIWEAQRIPADFKGVLSGVEAYLKHLKGGK